jgi:hypothetical protein
MASHGDADLPPHCVRALMPGQVRRSATSGTYASSPPHPGGTSLGYRSSTRAA